MLAFVPALWVGLIADDYVLLNTVEHVESVGWAFGHSDVGGDSGHFYRPLWVLWNAGIHELFGDRALAFHVANLALYAAVVIEVYALARLLVGEAAAWTAAIAFAVYPRHGESVVWISGSTDLLATALALAALGVLLLPRPVWLRVAAAAVLGTAAALSKEGAFVLPLLAVLVLELARRRRAPAFDRRLRVAPVALLVPQLVVFAMRYDVLEGFGGYANYPWRPLRGLGVAATYVLAAPSPPQLELFLYPELLVVPAAAAVAVAWGVRRLRTGPRSADLAVVVGGGAWFAVALLPALNIPIDLNNANGERFLFLPSVGLALALAGFVGSAAPSRRALAAFAAAVGLALALSWQASTDWVTASRLSDRLIDEAVGLAPQDGELVLLALPENFRTAHVFPGKLEVAVQRAGRPDAVVGWCLPVHVRDLRPGQIHARELPDRSYRLRTTWSAPFDFPLLSSAGAITGDCGYERADSRRFPLGLGLAGRATPTPSRAQVRLALFDGERLRPCCEDASG